MKDHGDGLLFIASALAACLALGCVPVTPEYGPAVGPPCVTGHQAGDALTVRLGVVYNAASDYLFDETLTQGGQQNLPSCAGRDGLQPDSVLTFTLTNAAGTRGGRCSPWLATLQPEPLAKPQLLDDWLLPYLDGITIADASRSGTLPGGGVDADRGLFTPSGNPDGVLTPVQRPPLVVTRGLRDTATGARCFDAWVAAWEPAP